MMWSARNVRFAADPCEASPSGARMATRVRPPIDPLDAAYRAAQAAYREGLLASVNARRRAARLAPVRWPAVGATPRREVWRSGPATLSRYEFDATASRNDATASKSAPLLLVCSLINRPYVLDLIEERSVVRRLLAGGRDVWL